jgi:hypothetical protein
VHHGEGRPNGAAKSGERGEHDREMIETKIDIGPVPTLAAGLATPCHRHDQRRAKRAAACAQAKINN